MSLKQILRLQTRCRSIMSVCCRDMFWDSIVMRIGDNAQRMALTAPGVGPNKLRLSSCSSVLLRPCSYVLGIGTASWTTSILLRRILVFKRNNSAISKLLVS